MLTLSQTILFYKRKEIQEAIIEAAENKEIAVRFSDKGFGKRPEVLKFPGDVLDFAIRGATSFHASEELWLNPLQISTSLKQAEINELRTGWDLVLDIDCPVLEYSGLAAQLVVEALKYHGIKSISVKFSGNHGFHIAVPFESFPESVGGEDSRKMFPKMPKAIALYIKDMISEPLNKAILEHESGDISVIAERTGMDKEVILDNPESDNPNLNVETFLEIDTILISPRHLYRMPYSFNEKSGLVSIPISLEQLKNFDINLAKPQNVVVSNAKFLDRSFVVPNEAKRLSVQALDYISKTDIDKKVNEEIQKSYKTVVKELSTYEEVTEKIPEELFPPCIHLMKKGMEDGKKRGLFALVNFLTSVGWNYEDIEDWLYVWNENNEKVGEGLRETLINGQLRYHKMQRKKILPPNCDNLNYYKSIGMSEKAVCQPDNFCKHIKNPVQYAKRKLYLIKQSQDGRKKKSNINEQKKSNEQSQEQTKNDENNTEKN